MTIRDFYESIGASYDSVLVRFGSEKMITKFAKKDLLMIQRFRMKYFICPRK